MNQELINFNINPEIKLQLQNDIASTFNKILSTRFRRMLFSKKIKITFMIFVVVCFGIFLAATLFFIFASMLAAEEIALVVIVFTASLILLLGILLATNNKISKEIIKELTATNLRYWKIICQNNDFKISRFTNQFDLIPDEILPIQATFLQSTWIENVLIGQNDHVKFNIGSMIEKQFMRHHPKKRIVYNRYLYFTSIINYEAETKINLEFLKQLIKDTMKDLNQEAICKDLFFQEFQKTTNFNPLHNEIIMNQIWNYAKLHHNFIPEIHLNNNKITLLFIYHDVKLASQVGDLGFLALSTNQEEFYRNVINMLHHDIRTINNCQTWVKILGF